MRSQDKIEKLQKTHSKPFSVQGIVEVDPLLDYYFNNQQDVIKKNTGPSMLKIDTDHDLVKPVINEMQKTLQPFKVRTAHFFDVTFPHIIHNDDQFNYPESYKAFTLPLKIYGDSKDIKLVMTQYYYGGPAKFFNGEQKTEDVYYNAPRPIFQVHHCNTKGIYDNFKKEHPSI